jgi:hypothetical protein
MTKGDWVVLCGGAEFNVAWHRECMRRKCRVICAPTDGDWLPLGRELARAVARRRLASCVLGSWRLRPALAALRELADGGALGTLQSAELSCAPTLADDPLQCRFAQDAVSFISYEKLHKSLIINDLENFASIRLEGDCGMALLNLSQNGVDTLEHHGNAHRRCQRTFPMGDPLLAEVALLESQTPEKDGWPLLCSLPGFFEP